MPTKAAKDIPLRAILPSWIEMPESPTTNITEVRTIFLERSKSTLESTKIRRPEVPIMPYSRKEIPPITGPGMVPMRAVSLPMKAQQMESTAAPPMTRTL